jgi:O-antigen ligase
LTDQQGAPADTSERRAGASATAVYANQLRHQNSRFVWLARALAFLLAGYLLLDRAFAWLHVPGTPIFIGEVVLAFGLYVAFRSRAAPRFIRLSPAMQILVVFMAFGFLLTVIGAAEHDPIEALRDAAIFYYGLFAIVIGALVRAWQPGYEFFLRNYVRIIPVFLVFGLFRLFLANSETGLFVPDSEVWITSHKPGNIGVQAAILVTFLLLVEAPSSERRDQVRNVWLTAGGLALLAAAGTQNRGSLVAGFAAMLIIYSLGRASRPVIAKVLVVMMAAVLLAFAFNLRVDLERRTLSVEQLFENMFALTPPSPDEGGTYEDDGTIAWRLQLWDLVLDDTLSAERFLTGFGFGPNLAGRYGYVAGPEIGPELRNPHNSHLSVVARMGLIGTVLWIAFWAIWYRALWKARRRFVFVGEDQKAGFLALCMIAALAFLINGVFDPSLEGPQAAVWLWCIVGIGAAVAVDGTTVRWRHKKPERLAVTL